MASQKPSDTIPTITLYADGTLSCQMTRYGAQMVLTCNTHDAEMPLRIDSGSGFRLSFGRMTAAHVHDAAEQLVNWLLTYSDAPEAALVGYLVARLRRALDHAEEQAAASRLPAEETAD